MNSPQPTDWHRRPKGSPAPCVVCGFPGKHRSDHRATVPADSTKARWIVRTKGPGGYRYREAGAQTRITGGVKRRIRCAAEMFAAGRSFASIAETLEVTPNAVRLWRKTHPRLWAKLFRKAAQGLVDKVRKTAGTDAVLADADGYMHLAVLAEKWAAAEGVELFPTSQVDLSLTGFYKMYYAPACLGNVLPESKLQYEYALRQWTRITGDPPLRLITNTIMAKFRDALAMLKGRGGHPYSPNTVRSKLVHIQAILDAAGPPGPRRRDAAGLLAKVPYCKPPREELDVPRIVSAERLAAVYRAADLMDCPQGHGIEPAQWWRSLLAVALNTALRHRALFELQWPMVDWEGRLLRVPKELLRKSRAGQTIPLNDTAVAHLESIRADDGFIFPWGYSRECFGHKFKLLQGLAGIPPGERFGLQILRRTAGTLLCQTSGPAAAQIILGHHSTLVTFKHYINPRQIGAAALDKLPQPWAQGNA